MLAVEREEMRWGERRKIPLWIINGINFFIRHRSRGCTFHEGERKQFWRTWRSCWISWNSRRWDAFAEAKKWIFYASPDLNPFHVRWIEPSCSSDRIFLIFTAATFSLIYSTLSSMAHDLGQPENVPPFNSINCSIILPWNDLMLLSPGRRKI